MLLATVDSSAYKVLLFLHILSVIIAFAQHPHFKTLALIRELNGLGVQVDARHGRPTLRTLDEAAARKVMGGKDRTLRPDTSGALLAWA